MAEGPSASSNPTMKSNVRGSLVLGLAGAGICVAGLVRFLLVILFNKLPWSSEQPLRHYYQEVGRSYTQGFLVGFFLCFSLALASVGVSTWWDSRRREARVRELP